MSKNAIRFAVPARDRRTIACAEYDDSREKLGPIDPFSQFVSSRACRPSLGTELLLGEKRPTFFRGT